MWVGLWPQIFMEQGAYSANFSKFQFHRFRFCKKKGYFVTKYSLYVSECSEFSKYNLSMPTKFGLQRVVWVYGAKIIMEQGLKSGKSNNWTGYPEKTPAAHTRHFRGHVPPPAIYS